MSVPPDQQLFNTLNSITNGIVQTSTALVDSIERHIDDFALHIRDSLSSSSWLPAQARPAPSPPRTPPSLFTPRADEDLLSWARRIVSENTAVCAAAVAFAGTGGYVLWRRRAALRRRRKARRAVNKARKECVVATGSIDGVISRSVLLDLERRDFIVYVAVGSDEEVDEVKQYRNSNIRPLQLELSDAARTQEAVSSFTTSLRGGTNHASSVRIAGLVVMPSITSSAAIAAEVPPSDLASRRAAGVLELERLPPTMLSDALNTSVLYPITIIRALLPALKSHQSRVVFLTPSISPSLAPGQSLAATVAGALDGFSAALAGELHRVDIPVVQLKLGKFNLDKAHLQSGPQQLVPFGAKKDTRKRQDEEDGHKAEGSPVRALHDAVFDALELPSAPGGVWPVGQGSWLYGMMERVAPWGSTRWKLGLRAAKFSWHSRAEDRSVYQV